MGMISEEDLELFHFFDDVDRGLDYLKPRLKEIITKTGHFIP
jgi:hypothetical protein